MGKDTLTLSNITNDLKSIAFFNFSNMADWRFAYIVPITLLALLIGFLLKNIWLGFLIFLFAVYHIVRFVMEYKNHRARKQALNSRLERGEISISIEKLSHITEEMIYEPYTSFTGRGRSAKQVTFYHFHSGVSWRVPSGKIHYEWSKDYHMSSKGLENISISGNDFFYISLQGYHDVVYVYPCNCFVLDNDLISKNVE
ncbi:MAG: hypothetical protein IJX13_08545 [Clostridia bacterium]|nr:hypothetical protein [Clostridia bacterium]